MLFTPMFLRSFHVALRRPETMKRESVMSFHVALRRPETMKRESVMRFRMCGKMGQDERWSEVVKSLSFNSIRSLSRVAQTRPKLSLRQAPEER
jgi:hypothetical protein